MKRRKGDVLVIAVMVSAFLCGAISYAIARMFGVSTMAVNSYNRNLQARQYALNISEEVSVLDFDSIVEKKTDKLERIAGSNYYKMVDITTDLTVVPNVRKANINVYHKDDLANAVSSVVVTKYSENEKDVLYGSAGSHTDNSITEEALYTTYLPKKDAVFASSKVGSEINPIYVDKDGNLKPTDIEFRNQYNTAAKKLAVWNGNEINFMNANDIAVPIGGAGSVSTNAYIKFPNGLIFDWGSIGGYERAEVFVSKPVKYESFVSNGVGAVTSIPGGITAYKWRHDERHYSNRFNAFGGNWSGYHLTVGKADDKLEELYLLNIDYVYYVEKMNVHLIYPDGREEDFNDSWNGYYRIGKKYFLLPKGTKYKINYTPRANFIIPGYHSGSDSGTITADTYIRAKEAVPSGNMTYHNVVFKNWQSDYHLGGSWIETRKYVKQGGNIWGTPYVMEHGGTIIMTYYADPGYAPDKIGLIKNGKPEVIYTYTGASNRTSFSFTVDADLEIVLYPARLGTYNNYGGDED